jgi:nucleoside-triphosphatase
MIILITGKPGVGKSTAINAFVEQYTGSAHWVITTAIPNPEGGRLGFKATNSDGRTEIISHKTDINSDVVIGVNHVDVSAVDAMFAQALQGANSDPHGALTVVDEIGPIQLLSDDFRAALKDIFAHNADVIASIHYKDEQLASYRDSHHAILLQVTPDNRDMLPLALIAIATHRQAFNSLSASQQGIVRKLLQAYVGNAQLVQIQKLTHNALYYVTEGRVQQTGPGSWTLAGKHGDYTVTKIGSDFTCTCDLFTGRGKYQDMPGECSHIQTVQLSQAA